MPFDELLAERVRRHIGAFNGVVEKRMFGGVGFLLCGNVSCGIHGSQLIVRIDPAEMTAALAEPGTRIFDLTGRPMKGWLFVSHSALRDDQVLSRWVHRGLAFAATLPRK